MDNEDLFRKAIAIWGIKNQILTINEEQNELTIELCSYLEKSNGKYALINNEGLDRIVEEIADVLLTLNYGELILAKRGEVDEILANIKNTKRISKERLILKLIYHMNRLSKKIHHFIRKRHSIDNIALHIAKVRYWITQLIEFLGITSLVTKQYECVLKKLEKKVEETLFT